MIGIAKYSFEAGRASRSIEDIASGLCTPEKETASYIEKVKT